MKTQLFQSSKWLRRIILLCFIGFLLVEATLFLWTRNPLLYAPGNRKLGFGLVAFKHRSLRSVRDPVDSQGNLYFSRLGLSFFTTRLRTQRFVSPDRSEL